MLTINTRDPLIEIVKKIKTIYPNVHAFGFKNGYFYGKSKIQIRNEKELIIFAFDVTKNPTNLIENERIYHG